MIVKKIRLRNFRLVEDSTFSPEPTGITGLVGPNGSGKSSFLIGLRWALFGIRPEGEKNSGLIRQAALVGLGDKERIECFVDAEVQIDDHVLRVVRSMTRKGTVSAQVWVDGNERTTDSTGAANKAIISFLGMTPDMFTIAHVIGQDELNMLVDARPAKRRELVEGSVGIDVLSDAVGSASTDLSATPTSVDMSEEVERLRTAYRDAQTHTADMREVYESTEARDIESIESSLKELQESQRRFEEAESNRKTLNDILDTFGEQVRAMDAPSKVPDVPDPDPELQRLRTEALSTTRARSQIMSQIEKLGNPEKMDTETVVRSIDTGVDWVSEKRTLLSALTSEAEEMRRFDSKDITDVCPLCGSEIHDPERTRRERDARIRQLLSRIDETQKSIEKGDKRLSTLRTGLRNAQEQNVRFEQLMELKSSLENLPDVSVENVDAQIREESLLIAEKRREAATAVKLNDQFASMSDVIARIENLPVVNDFSAELALKESELRDARAVNDARTRARYQLDNAEDSESRAFADMENAERRDKESRRINEERFIRASTVAALRAYREEMLSLLGPELEASMSMLVSEMTSEEYVSVRLDDGFNAYITSASGEERPVSSLSGGERAIVSLALRMSLGGDNTGLLWMDEVGSALDTDRLGTFMTGLHELPRQIIVVDHRDNASDEYDHVVRLARNSESGWIVD